MIFDHLVHEVTNCALVYPGFHVDAYLEQYYNTLFSFRESFSTLKKTYNVFHICVNWQLRQIHNPPIVVDCPGCPIDDTVRLNITL